MSSADTRARRNARYFVQELDGVRKRAQARLRDDLADDVSNMLSRCDRAGVSREGAADWLHGKTFDDTYHDYGAPEKQQRTRPRVKAWLDVCEGDEGLFLTMYIRELERYFPIRSASFEWAPRLKRNEKGLLTIVHRWRRRKK